MHQVSANRVMLEQEAMQAIAIMHLWVPLWATAQLVLEQFIELRRVRLACSRLHHLSDEESEQFVLACAVVGELFGVGGDHGIDHALNGAGVGNLFETLRLDDG